MERKKKDFLNKPVYPGGPKAMSAFIYEQLRYPAEALAAGIEGVVLVEYDIDNKGKVIQTRVLKGIGHGCDEEACRVVQLLQFEVEKNRGLRVIFHQKARIQFKKPPQAPQQAVQQQPIQQQINIHYVATSAPAPLLEEKPPAQVYQYTITIK